MDVIDIANKFGLKRGKILNVYPYGSRVYGCSLNNSDYDYIVVVNNCEEISEPTQLKKDNVDITIYTKDQFIDGIKNHEISLIECISLPKDKLLKDYLYVPFYLDKTKLRESISSKASNSFVKCKKKLTIQEDYDSYIAKKSLFHSLRILIFGMQIARYGKIVNFRAANDYYDEIVKNARNDWEYYKDKYQPIYNRLKSEFKLLCPK